MAKHKVTDRGSPLLTIEEFAELMGWSPQTVHQRRYRGEPLPPAIEIGRTVRFRRSDVESWLKSHTATDNPPGG